MKHRLTCFLGKVCQDGAVVFENFVDCKDIDVFFFKALQDAKCQLLAITNERDRLLVKNEELTRVAVEVETQNNCYTDMVGQLKFEEGLSLQQVHGLLKLPRVYM